MAWRFFRNIQPRPVVHDRTLTNLRACSISKPTAAQHRLREELVKLKTFQNNRPHLCLPLLCRPRPSPSPFTRP